MKLTFATKTDAQARADSIHVALIADSPLYAESAALYISSGGKAGTARWDFPWQDIEQDEKSPNFGKPIDTLWHITVDERARRVMVKAEVDTISEWQAVKEGI